MIGNIIKIQDDLKSLPEKELINEAQNPSGLAPIYLVLGELQRREKVKAEFVFVKLSHTAKTLLGQSSVFVSVPAPKVKSLLLDDWSVIVFPSFKIVKPFIPIVIDGAVFIFHSPVVASVEPKSLAA